MRICFLIRQLNDGGAQRQLLTLLQGLDRSRCEVTVVTFYDGGTFSGDVAAIPGVKCIGLAKKGRWDVLPFVVRLVRRLRSARPDVLYSYLGISNILASLVRPLIPGTRVVWSVRNSDMDFARYGWLHVLAYRVECFLSRFADLVIANSASGRSYAVSNGFPEPRTVVVPNGIDIARFTPSRAAGRTVRAEWGVGEDDFLVGLVGRIDPMKDHETFLRAASLVAAEHHSVKFVCVGPGDGDYAAEMKQLALTLGLSDRLIWAGRRRDLPALYNSLDLLVSSSRTEGFPNVVAEAMACGIPCVVTDVGDSRDLVGETGLVVPPGDPRALADAMSEVATKPGAFAPEAIRERIAANYSMERMIIRTEDQLCCLTSTA